jgi:hypothetical protein
MKPLLAAIIVLLWTSLAVAQLQGPFPMSKATLQWQWTRGAPPMDGTVAEFLIKCGDTTPGQYTQIVKVVSTSRSVAISNVLTHSGDWYCVVTGSNINGETPPTNEVHFTGEASPVGPTGLVVVIGP